MSISHNSSNYNIEKIKQEANIVDVVEYYTSQRVKKNKILWLGFACVFKIMSGNASYPIPALDTGKGCYNFPTRTRQRRRKKEIEFWC